jgi:MFS family permease
MTDLESQTKSPPAQDAKTTDDANAIQEKSASETTASEDDLLVTWNGPDDPENPKNWSALRRWSITILLSLGGFVCLMSSTMLAPALETIAEDMHVSQSTANMTLSIFVLAFAFGPMVLAPMAEVFGRRNVWLLCSIWYALWNMACGFAHTNGLLLASRILAGLGSSVEYAIGQPVLGDLWRPEQRGLSFAIATFVPLLGPAIGPLLGGVITGSIGWRWVFWVLSIFDGLLILIAFFIFSETYGSLLLHRKAHKLSKESGKQYHTEFDMHNQPLATKLKNGLLRPCRLLLQQPVIQLMSLMMAFNYGTLFFVLASYAMLWTAEYNQTVTVSGLHYLALAVGYTIAAQGGARVTDRIWKRLKEKAGGQTAPEYRVPLMIPGILCVPVGLIWYGWAAQAKTHWVVVDIGGAVFAFGTILSTQAMQQYTMESFREHVASAVAASQLLRSIFGFCFPLFAPALYTSLGYGWGNTTIALVFCGLAIPGPFLLWFFGARLRARGAVVK